MSQIESIQLVVATSTELEVTIREFLLVLRGKGRVKDTIERYRRHLSAWGEWLAQRGVSELNGITTLLLREWGAEIQEHPDWSPTTAKLVVSVVHSFLSWCNEEERISRRLLDSLSIPSAKTKVQRTLTEDEIQLMLDSCNDSVIGIRGSSGIFVESLRGDRQIPDISWHSHFVPQDVGPDLSIRAERHGKSQRAASAMLR